MSRSCRRAFAPGFTLVEVLVVVATLGMILWMVGQLLFPMRQAAERQRLQVEARQAARAACDYVTFAVRSATDMNRLAQPFRNPALILTFVWEGVGTGVGSNPSCLDPTTAGCVQTSWNNVPDTGGNPTMATPGTDIITVGRAVSVVSMSSLTFDGGLDNHADSDQSSYWSFNQGCMNDVNNAAMFGNLTGRHATAGGDQSLPLMLVDSHGSWAFYQITDYQDGDNAASCSSPPTTLCNDTSMGHPVPCVVVKANPSSVAGMAIYNAPGGPRTLIPTMYLYPGVHYTAFRVCNGWLEQKDGIFDPAVDTNCPSLAADAEFPTFDVMIANSPGHAQAGWSPLLPNVEDLQFAYVFRNGTVWNGPAGTLAVSADQKLNAPAGVPVMVGNSTPTPPDVDVVHVIGVRVTVTARSSTQVTVGGGKIQMRRPIAEDHDPGALPVDTYYRSQISAVAMLRNRLSDGVSGY